MTALASVSGPLGAAALKTALQPIVSLRDERVFAFEALLRVEAGIDIGELFESAARTRGAIQLNLAAIRSAIGAARSISSGALLFVNADPAVLASALLPEVIRDAAGRSELPLSRLVLEITERSPLIDVPATTRVLDELRASGIRFALDDFGSAHSHLMLIDAIAPSFLKIGHSFGTAFEENTTRRHIVRSFAALARDFACSTIVEGVESATTACAARELGIEYAQGYHFGAPVVSLCAKRAS